MNVININSQNAFKLSTEKTTKNIRPISRLTKILLVLLVCISFSKTVYGYDLTGPNKRIILERAISNVNYEIQGESYFVPIRYVTEYYGGEVMWEEEKGITLTFEETAYQPAYYINGSTAMVNLWDITEILNLEYYKDENLDIVSIAKSDAYLNNTDVKSIIPTLEGYTNEDLEWMAKIIHAEANGEPYEAKLAVGNVILNRKESGVYPSSIKGVIFDRKSGVQFTPTINGSIYNTPSNESFMAALEVLEGKRNAEGALFFINPRYAKSSWVSRNREFAFTLNNHDFYY